MDNIDFNAPLPKFTGKVYPIASPKPGAGIEGIILSDSLVAVNTHWWGGRSAPCTAPGSCEYCDYHKIGKRWKGYLAVWCPNSKHEMCLFEVSRQAATYQPYLTTSSELRGLWIRLRRKGASKQSPVVAELGKPTDVNELCLPAAFDVRQALLRIWFSKPIGE